MVPTDKGKDMTDLVVCTNACLCFIFAYVEFTPAFIITNLYVAVVLFGIDPVMYE